MKVPLRRLPVVLLAFAALLVTSCDDQLVTPAPPGSVALGIAYSAALQDGGASEAYDHADRAHIRLLRGTTAVVDTVVALTPGEEETSIRLEFQPSSAADTLSVEVELREETAPLFRGVRQVTVGQGEEADADIALVPVVASVMAQSPVEVIEALGDTVQLSATGLFATGHAVAGTEITWSAEGGVVEVGPDGRVVSVANGEASVVASQGDLSDAVQITVQQVVASVEVPSPEPIVEDESYALEAIAHDANGHEVEEATFEWFSSDESVVAVDGSGVVTARAEGSAAITAISGEASGVAQVTVLRKPVASVEVEPANPEVEVDQSTQLTATLFAEDGEELTGREVEWASSDEAVATVDSGGLVTGVSEGEATITATSEGVSGTAQVTVTPKPVASVEVEPAEADIEVDGTVQFDVVLRAEDGEELSGREVSWSSSDEGVATVDSDGVVTGVSEGEATITATSEGVSGTVQVTVAPKPVASVEVGPSEAEIEVGETVQLTAVVRGEDGVELSGREVSWSSSDNSVATVEDDGWVAGVSAGQVNITATVDGISGDAEVIVSSGFGSDFQFSKIEGTLNGRTIHGLWQDGPTVVAVGYGQLILRSIDAGQTWSTISSGPPNHLYSVWGEGSTMVAVGWYGFITRSTDGGVNWQSVDSGTSITLRGVWGNGSTVVAVGLDGVIVRSTDGGATWSEVDSGTSENLWSVAGDEQTIVAVGSNSTIVRSHDGGLTWSTVDSEMSTTFHSVWAEGSTVIAVGSREIVRSIDGGGSWESVYNGTTTRFTAVSGYGSTVLVVGYDGLVKRSMDGGVTWENRSSGITAALDAVTVEGSINIAAGWTGAIVHSNDAGATWESLTPGTPTRLFDVWGEGSIAVAVGETGTIRRSTDAGANWVGVNSAVTGHLNGVWGEGSDVVIVGNDGTILRSTDSGASWMSASSGVSEHLYAVWGDGSTVVAAGRSGTILRSLDGGVNWTSASSGTANELQGVWGDGSNLVIVGSNGVILRSTDEGATWMSVSSGTSAFLSDVWGEGTVLLAAGTSGTLRSADGGATWGDAVPGGGSLRGIAGDGSTVVVVGSAGTGSGTIRRSHDRGLNWTDPERVDTHYLLAVGLLDSEHVIAVGDGGLILRGTR